MKNLNENFEQKDYEDFLNPDVSKVQLISPQTPEIISRELVGSKFKIASSFFVLSVLGYVLNLSICAQGPLGLTQLSHEVFHALHLKLHSCLCALVCGLTFTSLPFALAFAFLNPFQRRFLLFHMSWFLALIPLISTVVIFIWTYHPLTAVDTMSFFGVFDLRMEIVNGFVWTASALCMPALLHVVFYRFHKQKVFHS